MISAMIHGTISIMPLGIPPPKPEIIGSAIYLQMLGQINGSFIPMLSLEFTLAFST